MILHVLCFVLNLQNLVCILHLWHISVWPSHVSSMRLLSVAGAPSCSSVSCVQSLSHVCLFVTPWTVASKATLSMEISKQKY